MFKNNYIKYIVFLCFLVSVSLNFYTIVFNKNNDVFDSILDNTNSYYSSIDSLGKAIYLVKNYYYKDIEDSMLITYAIKGVLENLDSYSTILDSKQKEELSSTLTGNFIGIGIGFTKDTDSIIVNYIFPNSPAMKSGLKIGDKISSINKEQVSNMSIYQVQEALSSTKHKIILLGLSSNATIKLSNDKIKQYTTHIEQLEDSLYIRIDYFNHNTANEIKDYFKNNNVSNISGLILDLRDNPGGLIDQAIEIADLFIQNLPIALISSKNLEPRIFLANKTDILNNKPIIILVNQNSASSAELLAGSLKYNNRALIIGENTYGKGVIQSIIPFDNNQEIKITTGIFYFPNGHTIPKDGINPDFIIKEDAEAINKALDLIKEQKNV